MTSLPKGTKTMTSLPLRRIRIAGLAVALAGAGVTFLAAPANAAAITGSAGGGVQASLGGGGCTVTGGPFTSPLPVLPLNSNSSTPFSASANATGTSSGNAADVTHVSASLQGTAFSTEVGGSAQSVGVDGVLSVTADSSFGLASACSGGALGTISGSATITVTTPAMLDLRVKARPGGYITISQASVSSSSGVSQDIAQFSGNDGRRLTLVQPGTYNFSFTLQSQLAGPSPIPTPKTRTMPFTFRADFRTPGTAEGASGGSGTKYLTLPDAINCSTGTATADFTAKAGKKVKKGKKGHKAKKPVIKQADFFVGDTKVASVKNPNRDTLTTLTGIAGTEETTVEAILKLSNDKGTVSVRRTYLPCR